MALLDLLQEEINAANACGVSLTIWSLPGKIAAYATRPRAGRLRVRQFVCDTEMALFDLEAHIGDLRRLWTGLLD